MLGAFTKFIEQFFTKKSTNLFPSKYTPSSVIDTLASDKINPPIFVNKNYRGQLEFDYDKCIGCGMCVKVCPANAIEMYPVAAGEKTSKRIVIYLAKCTFCSECVNICPKNAIVQNSNFLLSDFKKFSDPQVIGIDERRKNEIKDKS